MLYSVGQEIEAYCGKCQVVQGHTVVELKGPRISRVRCETCKDVHAFRKTHPKPTAASAEAQKAATERRRVAKAAAAFAAAMDNTDATNAVPYRHTTRFDADDIIEHQAFGVGRVMRILADNKIEVLFRSSSKILVHAGGPAAG